MKTFVMYTAFDYKNGKVTGGTRRFLEILYGLLNADNIVHLYIPREADIKRHKNLMRHNIYGKESRYFPNGLLNFLFNFNALRLIKKIQYDAFIIISVPYAIQCVLLRIKKLKFIIWEDFIGYKKIQLDQRNIAKVFKSILIWILTKLEKKVLSNVDKVIVQCEYDKKITLNRHKVLYKKLEPKFEILFNNVNPSWIIENTSIIINKNNYSRPFYQFIFIGNIDDKRKGLHILIEAFKLLMKQEYKCKLIIVGSGKLLSEYIEANEYKENIEFVGYLSNPLPLLMGSNLLIVPSMADSFPNTVMEALYYNIPVIGSKKGGIPEMLKYDELLFELSVESLYHRLKKIIDNNEFEELKKMGQIRKEALTFDWTLELEKMISK